MYAYIHLVYVFITIYVWWHLWGLKGLPTISLFGVIAWAYSIIPVSYVALGLGGSVCTFHNFRCSLDVYWDVDPLCLCSWLQSITRCLYYVSFHDHNISLYILHGCIVYLFWRSCLFSTWAWVCLPLRRDSSNTRHLFVGTIFYPRSIRLLYGSSKKIFWPLAPLLNHTLGGICYTYIWSPMIF